MTVELQPLTESHAAGVLDLLSHHICDANLADCTPPIDVLTDDTTDDYGAVAVDPDTKTVRGITVLRTFSSLTTLQRQFHCITPIPPRVIAPDDPATTFGLIQTGYVHPDWMRQGIGRRLLTHIEDTAADRDVDVLYIETQNYDQSADGRSLVEAAGYTRIFHQDRYWPASVREDAVCSQCGADCTCSGSIYRKHLSPLAGVED